MRSLCVGHAWGSSLGLPNAGRTVSLGPTSVNTRDAGINEARGPVH